MAERSLGVVNPFGTGAKRSTSNELDPAAAVWAHSYRVQHWVGNSQVGRGFVGGKNMDGVGSDAFGVVPSQAAAPPWPIYSSPEVSSRENPFNMADVYIDSEVSTDGFLVTFMAV